MKNIHVLEIKKAISGWMARGAKIKIKTPCIICAATRFNWEVFYAAKVKGNSVRFLASELYPYLTTDQVGKALMHITGIDGKYWIPPNQIILIEKGVM